MSGGGLPSSMPAPLRLSLQLGDGETAVSFAARLGTRNGASDAKRFCADVGLSYARLSAGEPAEIRRLACLGGADGSCPNSWCRSAGPRRGSDSGQAATAGSLTVAVFVTRARVSRDM